MKRVLLLAAALALAGLGLGHTGAAKAADLVVSAASSLTNAFRAEAKAYEAAHLNTHVVLNFAASDVLMRQIENGAPADLFASADQVAMDKAQKNGLLLANTRSDFARNQLVVIVPAGSKTIIHSLKDLQQPRIKLIAFGDPASVPVGRYTRDALTAAGEWTAIRARGVLAINVRQALDYVARDAVDAGFVYATDAAIMPRQVTVALRVPSTTPITYPMAILSSSRHVAAACSFQQFVLSPQGQSVLARYGFLKP